LGDEWAIHSRLKRRHPAVQAEIDRIYQEHRAKREPAKSD
jgi:hypothetical protein